MFERGMIDERWHKKKTDFSADYIPPAVLEGSFCENNWVL